MVEYRTTSLRLCIFTLLSMQLHSLTNVLLNASCNSELPRRQLEDLASFQLEVGGSVQELTDEDCRHSSRIAGNASLRQGNDTDARSSLASTWLKDTDAIIGPVAMMFNVTDAALRGLEAQHDFCGEYCNGTQKISKSSRCFKWPHCRRCYCDDSCGMYGDCCPQQGSKTSRAAVRTKDSFTKCVSVCHGRRRHLVSAVCSCPPHAPSSARRDCRGSGSSDASTPPHPVLSANLSVLYCSADCAWCHGESDVVELTAGCREEHDEDYVNSWADDSQHDTILMAWQVPRNYSPRACYDVHFTKEPQQVISCNATWFPEETAKNIADLCANYTSPVLADGVIFENLFCALCNDIRPKCLPVTTLRSVSGTSILVNLMGSTTVGPKSCKSEEWYDVAKASTKSKREQSC